MLLTVSAQQSLIFGSFGSDEITEYDYTFALFILGDVDYTLFDQSGRDAEFLYEMASEILAERQEA